jgi:hypothetical protein
MPPVFKYDGGSAALCFRDSFWGIGFLVAPPGFQGNINEVSAASRAAYFVRGSFASDMEKCLHTA